MSFNFLTFPFYFIASGGRRPLCFLFQFHQSLILDMDTFSGTCPRRVGRVLISDDGRTDTTTESSCVLRPPSAPRPSTRRRLPVTTTTTKDTATYHPQLPSTFVLSEGDLDHRRRSYFPETSLLRCPWRPVVFPRSRTGEKTEGGKNHWGRLLGCPLVNCFFFTSHISGSEL